MRRLVLWPILPLLTFTITPCAGAKPAGEADVQVVAHGIRLSLSMPGTKYPQDALLRVTVRAENVSLRPVKVWLGDATLYPCGSHAPSAQVVTGSGKVVYPPALRRPLYFFCPLESGWNMAPHQVILTHPLVILRDSYVRAVIRLRAGLVATPKVRIDLVPAARPRVALHTSPTVQAAIHPPGRGHRGRLYYLETWTCHGQMAGATNWRSGTAYRQGRVRGMRLWPGCPHPSDWNAVVGWLNQPVATIDYVR